MYSLSPTVDGNAPPPPVLLFFSHPIIPLLLLRRDVALYIARLIVLFATPCCPSAHSTPLITATNCDYFPNCHSLSAPPHLCRPIVPICSPKYRLHCHGPTSFISLTALLFAPFYRPVPSFTTAPSLKLPCFSFILARTAAHAYFISLLSLSFPTALYARSLLRILSFTSAPLRSSAFHTSTLVGSW